RPPGAPPRDAGFRRYPRSARYGLQGGRYRRRDRPRPRYRTRRNRLRCRSRAGRGNAQGTAVDSAAGWWWGVGATRSRSNARRGMRRCACCKRDSPWGRYLRRCRRSREPSPAHSVADERLTERRRLSVVLLDLELEQREMGVSAAFELVADTGPEIL